MYNIFILGLVSLLTDISSEMVYPLIPLFLTLRLGATPAIVGAIEGLAESTASLLKVFAGQYSDRIQRRKPVAIAGYSSATLGKLFLILASSWPWVLAGRLTDRFGKGIRTAPRDALIAESASAGRLGAAFGLHRLMDNFGAVIGIALAYYFFVSTVEDYQRLFLWSLVPAFAGVGLLYLVREAKPKGGPGAWSAPVRPVREVGHNRLKELLSGWKALDPGLRGFFIVIFIFTLGNSSNQFLLLRAYNVGFEPHSVILLYLVFSAVSALVAYPSGRLSDRIGRRSLLVGGYIFYGLVYLGFAVTGRAEHVWLLFGLYGLYAGLTEGVEKALVADLAPARQKATLMGLHATIVGIGLFPASLLAGLLWGLAGPAAPFYFGGLVGLSAAAGMAYVLKLDRAGYAG